MEEYFPNVLINLILIIGVLVFKKIRIKLIFFALQIGYLIYWFEDSKNAIDGWARMGYLIEIYITVGFLIINTVILLVLTIIGFVKWKKNK